MEILSKKATPPKNEILSMRQRRAQANFTQKTQRNDYFTMDQLMGRMYF